jgi:hypothetical protein
VSKYIRRVLICLLIGVVFCFAPCGSKNNGGVLWASDQWVIDFSNTGLTSTKASFSKGSDSRDQLPEHMFSDLLELKFESACDQPITIKYPVPKDDLPEGINNYLLGIGVDVIYAGDKQRDTIYTYIQMEEVDGMLTASFTPSDFDEIRLMGSSSHASSTPSGYTYKMGITGGEIYYEQNGHFRITFPGITGMFSQLYVGETTGEKLLQALEAAYAKFLTLGYTYSFRENWPMEVTVDAIGGPGEDELAVYSYGWNIAEGKIMLNKSLFEKGQCDMTTLTPLLVHEFFHFVQGNYISNEYNVLWFDEATASYYEYEALGHAPSSLYNEAMLLLEGVFPASDTASDGYARVSLIKYLRQRYGDNFILDMYKLLGNGGFEDAYNLVSGGEDPRLWATDFYVQHLSGSLIGSASPISFGEIYNHVRKGRTGFDRVGQPVQLTIPDRDEIEKLKKDGDEVVLGEVSLRAPSYGVRFAPIIMDDGEIDKLNDNDAVAIKCSDPNAQVTVITLQGSSGIKTIQTGDVILDSFKKSVADNRSLYLIMVTGLQDAGSADYKVSVTLAEKPLYGFVYSGGPYSKLSEIGMVTALKGADVIKLDKDGDFAVDVPSASVTIPTSSGTKSNIYTFNVSNFTMNGHWNQSLKTGDASFSFDMNLLRTETSKMNTFAGEDSRAYVTTYDYYDTVTGTAVLSENGDKIAFDVKLSGIRNGQSVMKLHVVYSNGKEYWGDNPTITPVNSKYSGKATHLFTPLVEADEK